MPVVVIVVLLFDNLGKLDTVSEHLDSWPEVIFEYFLVWFGLFQVALAYLPVTTHNTSERYFFGTQLGYLFSLSVCS